ncbi:MAG: inner membrane protein YiaA [Leptolyngbyaceae cyanobacterium]
MAKPTPAFIGASYCALSIGMAAFLTGLWKSSMGLAEKGFYFTVLMYGLYAAVSVQKSVRDRSENIPVTDLYYGISWLSTIMCISLLLIGLWNATWELSEKGFYAMAFLLSLFGAIAVQKNTRDVAGLHRLMNRPVTDAALPERSKKP